MTMDQALEKFKLLQNEQTSYDHIQKGELHQFRGCVIGRRLDEDNTYDKISKVHQPKATGGKTRRASSALDTIYAMVTVPRPPPRNCREKEPVNVRKLPKMK